VRVLKPSAYPYWPGPMGLVATCSTHRNHNSHARHYPFPRWIHKIGARALDVGNRCDLVNVSPLGAIDTSFWATNLLVQFSVSACTVGKISGNASVVL
jgi:hypothetical protein